MCMSCLKHVILYGRIRSEVNAFCFHTSLSLPELFPELLSGALSLLLNVFAHNEISQLRVSVKSLHRMRGWQFPLSREEVLCCFLAGIVPKEALLSFPMVFYLMRHFFFKSLFQDFPFIFSVASFRFFVLFRFLFCVHRPESACLFHCIGEVFFAHLYQSFFQQLSYMHLGLWVTGAQNVSNDCFFPRLSL